MTFVAIGTLRVKIDMSDNMIVLFTKITASLIKYFVQ